MTQEKEPTEKLTKSVRQRKVAKLIAQGKYDEEIATELNVGRATITRDKRAIKKRIKTFFKQDALEEILTELTLSHEQAQRELWKLYNNTKNENVLLGTQKQLIGLLNRKIDLLQKLGIIDKAPDLLKVETTTLSHKDFEKFYSELNERVDKESSSE